MEQHFLVLIVDRQHGHFYSLNQPMGQLRKLEDIEDDVPKSVKAASWKGLGDDKVARHVDAHLHEHLKHLVQKLEQHLRHEDAKLVLGGPEEVLAEFLPTLPQGLTDRIVGTFHPDHYVGIKDLDAQVQKLITSWRTSSVQTLLETIKENQAANGRGVIGTESVYEALNLKQVQSLVYATDGAYPGYYCLNDGAVSELSSTCPLCLSTMESTPDLTPKLLVSAASQGAEVHVLTKDQFQSGAILAALKRYTD